MRRDFALQTGGARVTGIVQDRDGGPVAGARVHVLGMRGPVAAVVSALSADDGAFDLTVDEGPVTVLVAAEGYCEAQHTTTAPSTAIRIELSPASRLSGVVVSKTNATPLGGVVVTATPRDSLSYTALASATTDDAGRFVIDGLIAGTYELEGRGSSSYGRLAQPVAADAIGAFRVEGVPAGVLAVSASCSWASREPASPGRIEVGSEAIARLELVLAEAVSVRGRVVDDRGRGVAEREGH